MKASLYDEDTVSSKTRMGLHFTYAHVQSNSLNSFRFGSFTLEYVKKKIKIKIFKSIFKDHKGEIGQNMQASSCNADSNLFKPWSLGPQWKLKFLHRNMSESS